MRKFLLWIGSAAVAVVATAPGFAQQPQAATPTFSSGTGTYYSDQTVTISDATPGAVIYYTNNGEAPTTAHQYFGPITIQQSETITAMAGASGYANSSVATATYTLAAATPMVSVPAGTYDGPQTVAVTTATPTAGIWYTTDGSTPNPAVSTLYTHPITVAASETLKVIAAKNGFTSSAVVSVPYVIGPVATPVLFPANATGITIRYVTITDKMPGATIYYTTDGSTPTTNSAEYSGPITVNQSETIQAIAVLPGLPPSPVASGAYVVEFIYPIVGIPGGTYLSYGDGGPAADAFLAEVSSMAFDSHENMYILDNEYCSVRMVSADTGIITTVVGDKTAEPRCGYSGDGGPATSAQLSDPLEIAVDSHDNLYVLDYGNDRVRMVSANTGIITAFAGNGTFGNAGDGGPATEAELGGITSMAIDKGGNLYLGNEPVNPGGGGYYPCMAIRKVAASTGIISMFADSSNFECNYTLPMGFPYTFNPGSTLALDSDGNLYLFNHFKNLYYNRSIYTIPDYYPSYIEEFSANTGTFTAIAGQASGNNVNAGDYGPALYAQFANPTVLAFDHAGNLYVGNTYVGAGSSLAMGPSASVRKISLSAAPGTNFGLSTPPQP